MNKKNITIDTDFFDDGIQATLKSYHNQNDEQRGGKLSGVKQQRKNSHDDSINNYRYEYVPDNEYSPQIQYQASNEHVDESQMTREQQSAIRFQDILSRVMANLFIRCWQQLKNQLPSRSKFFEDQSRTISQSVQLVHIQVQPTLNGKLQAVNCSTNVFSRAIRTNQQVKRQILERQRKGLTLDSLEKLRLDRSKSGHRLQAQRDIVSTKLKPLQQKQTLAQADQNQNQDTSRVTRKSYRQKFLQYKHRSKSRQQGGMLKSQNYTKFTTNHPYKQTGQTMTINQNGHYSVGNLTTGNVRSTYSKAQQSKNQILRNINQQLMDREEIYQGQNHKYYINHRDSSKNVYNSYNKDTFSYKNPAMDNLGATYKPFQSPSNMSEKNQHINGYKEVERARLLQEIVQKLNYSKLRLQAEKNIPDQLQIVRKIVRLQRVILELKRQSSQQLQRIAFDLRRQSIQQAQKSRTESVSNNNQSHLQTYSLSVKNQQEQLYRKFLGEISAIRSQINQIKTSRLSPVQVPVQVPIPIQTPIVAVDNSSRYIISQQQRLLGSYQLEFQRLLVQKQNNTRVIDQEVVAPAPQYQTAQKTIFDQLVQNGKNSQSKVDWDDRWQVKKQRTKLNQQQQNHFNGSSTFQQSRRKNQHLNKDQNFEVYRYTRNQVLEEIGLKAQIQEQRRMLEQHQSRINFDRQRREQQVKGMTQNVRFHRQQEHEIGKINQNNRPIRERYEQQWQRFHKTRTNNNDSDYCCTLFPC